MEQTLIKTNILKHHKLKTPAPNRRSGGFRTKIDLQVASYSITFLFF